MAKLFQKLSSSTDGKFGTIKGVFIPSILTIFGVIMYLRVGWVVGNVGLFGTIVIVLMSSSITLLTGLSISASATNMKVGAGGTYYMLSRSFGLETGAAIGVPLFFAQALGVSFYLAGFAEAVQFYFPSVPLQAIGVVTLLVLALLAFKSADLALRAQMIIFLAILASLVSFFLGGEPQEGWVMGDTEIDKVPFWAVFAVFFPAVTGIEAGVALSGNLKNPGRSLALGTGELFDRNNRRVAVLQQRQPEARTPVGLRSSQLFHRDDGLVASFQSSQSKQGRKHPTRPREHLHIDGASKWRLELEQL